MIVWISVLDQGSTMSHLTQSDLGQAPDEHTVRGRDRANSILAKAERKKGTESERGESNPEEAEIITWSMDH